ncbi:conserved exported hypothetical protein [metagenome]|uniref:Lipoprotein n=1 Tax=metagenome TaxID=256318 RepID=A0A2P2CBQ8_9ZZZZ
MDVKLAVALLVLLLTGCSSTPPAPAPDEPGRTWLGMVPGDAIPFDGPGGELVLIYVDETYSMDHVNASALTWRLGGDDYTTDYFVADDDGTVWWYGRRGVWRAGRHGKEPRQVDIVDHRARFGDRVIILSDDSGPVELELRDGTYTR